AAAPDSTTSEQQSGQERAADGVELRPTGEMLEPALGREIEDAHSDTVLGVEFSRDGKLLLSGGTDKFAKIFEVESGKHVRSFEGHTHHVMDASWKADGTQIVTAGADNAIKIWNTETGEQIRTISNYPKQVTAIQYVGDSDTIASCGGDASVRFHRGSNGQNTRNFGGSSDYVYAVAAARDAETAINPQTNQESDLIVAGGEDGTLRVWNAKNGQALFTFAPPKVEEAAQASR
ncbi:MAG TPA: hypothetical protein VML55_03005, partial [Planctomycetaceae bacterium]|nr:hypothetical protein [Planctomycetaceae bacterium]